MHKLALAAVITASLGGAGVVVVTATRSDAHAQPPATATQPEAHDGENPVACALRAASRTLAGGHAHRSVHPAPSLVGIMGGAGGASSSDHATNDCAAVARHLAELEADTTHGPSDRPDEASCDQCAAHYEAQCKAQNWSTERRSCTLAAADLINAHLCATGATTAAADKPSNIPPTLTCSALAPHLATTAQAAGFHADVPDLAQQIEAACDMGAWSIELRQCFAAAQSVTDLESCLGPH